MAFSDYGCVAKKNGILLPCDETGFMDMEEAVGCTIDDMDGNWLAFLGDKDLFIAIYKSYVRIMKDGKEVAILNAMEDSRLTYSKYRNKVVVDNIVFDFKRIGGCQFLVKFRYKNDFYKCLYGYGIGGQVHWWWKIIGIKKRNNTALKWLKYISY